MAEAITFRFDATQAERALDQLGTRAPAVIARVINRTATSVRAVMAREIAKDIGLPVGPIKDALKVQSAIPQADDIRARISVSGAKIPLAKFHASGPLPSRGRGTVSARIGGTRKRYEGAFLAQMRSGHIGVFRRKGPSTRKSRGAWSPNLPIVELKGPSLPQVFAKYVPLGIARGQEQLVKNLEHEVGFALAQAAG
jgi:hypothetical protein